ncbi:MAG TPA: SpoIIE family protein phosphatase [Mycobacteriales bacterium]|nr:SpoIIE family protein phosphatase [Mycobacteriales bacterium]
MTSSSGEALDAFYEALLDDDAEQLYDRAPCGYLSTTPDGSIIKVNQTFLTLTGYARAELVGRRSFVDLLTGGGRIYHETHYAPMLRMQGTAREIALDLVRADGSRLPALVNAVLERDDSDAPRVIRIAVFDATDRREYERELLRAKDRAEASEAHARSLAETLQQTLIPPTPPAIPGLDIAAAYRPAGDGTEVGGDFYDVFQLREDNWVVVIGDVRGKGVQAAAVTALARHTLRAAAIGHPTPSGALTRLNEVLLLEEIDRFCTVAFLQLSRAGESWTGTLCLGGHPQPLLRRPGGTVTAVGAPGMLLGVVADPPLPDLAVPLEPGAVLVLFTDGVTEARADGELYGEGRLRAAVTADHQTADAVTQAVLDDVMRYQSGWPRDDIALVTVRVPT